VVSAGKLRELWDFLSELRSSLCERRLETTVLRAVILPVKTAQFTQFFLGDPGVDGRIILRWIFRKWDVDVWTGSSWLRIGTGGGHL
jgi:hypothetical protein